MTYFLDFRTKSVGGAVVDPRLFEGDGTANPLALRLIPEAQVPAIAAGRDILFATHGFNVSRRDGANALGLLDRHLNLPPPSLFIGMLWPGDSWLPIVDYPFEGETAMDCGRRLAAFCNARCSGAASLSFVSHSLGARFILEAAAHLGRKARLVCLTAGAINRDTLSAEYSAATGNADAIAVLASRKDLVLRVAFSVGDPLAELLQGDAVDFQAALGYRGPALPPPQSLRRPWQIPEGAGFGHGSYLPPRDPDKWPRAADFIRRAFLGETQTWPPL